MSISGVAMAAYLSERAWGLAHMISELLSDRLSLRFLAVDARGLEWVMVRWIVEA